MAVPQRVGINIVCGSGIAGTRTWCIVGMPLRVNFLVARFMVDPEIEFSQEVTLSGFSLLVHCDYKMGASTPASPSMALRPVPPFTHVQWNFDRILFVGGVGPTSIGDTIFINSQIRRTRLSLSLGHDTLAGLL